MKDVLTKNLLGLMTGAVIGWGGNALTFSGRVTAIENSLIRMEQRLDQLVTQRAGK